MSPWSIFESTDWKRYYNDNPELQEDFDYDPKKCYRHYMRYGRKQGKKIHPRSQNRLLAGPTPKPIENYSRAIQAVKNRTQTQPVNVITRTHLRPSAFSKCKKSIDEQTYPNIVHWVLYDDSRSLSYLPIDKKTRRLFVEPKQGKYGYNKHINDALREIQEGWIVVLDDDDMFADPCALDIILSMAEEDTVVFWKHRFGTALKSHSTDVRDIPSCCFLYSSKHKDKTVWSDKDCASGEVALSLLEVCSWKQVQDVLTSSIGPARNRGKPES